MTRMLLAKVVVSLAVVGTAIPPHALAVEPSGSQSPSRAATPQIRDVELDAAGTLHGTIVNQQGRTMEGSPVRIERPDSTTVETKCDADGQFAIQGLKGGVYQLRTAQHTEIVRLWSAQTAPPAATRHVVVAPGPLTLRGQHHIGDVFRSDGFIVAAIIAAAIAIPVVVHNSRDRASDRDDDSSS